MERQKKRQHPEAPQNLQYEATSSSVTVTWSPVDGADSYNVYRGENKVFAENVTDTSFTADGLSADTQLTINVTAVNEAGESSMSEIITRTLQEAG
ncbi:alkaline phosphatase [Bacillus pumilus]|uniref:Alkaline phosphatase n=1 Tax=Bacillus pumilus TaxID=1408 RepID=A0A2A5IK51_BACPU|nr:fibronectin type III domain-containing protein [Bacillus pumilus]PCK17720.1 alkaline phosphatase [Bacillus pumilus]